MPTPSAANPLGCWGWWGYSGAGYLTRDGVQMKALTDWVLGLLNDSSDPNGKDP